MMQSQNNSPERKKTGKSMHLLLVDDDDIALLKYRRIADSSGFFSSIRSAKNGVNALHILNQAEQGVFPVPDVILLDLDMPVINGITFLKVLQKWDVWQKDQISIIAMIDDASERQGDALNYLGARYFLTKPISFASFKEIVEMINLEKMPTRPF